MGLTTVGLYAERNGGRVCMHGYVSVVMELRAQSKTWDTNGKGDGGSGSIMVGEEY